MGYVLFLFVSMKELIVFNKVFYSPNGICHIVFDFLVLQSEHLDTLAVQELRAFRIASFGLLAFMHCPVHFYAQLDFRAIEIHHIRPEAMLSAEFESVDLSAAYQFPKYAFTRGGFSAKLLAERLVIRKVGVVHAKWWG